MVSNAIADNDTVTQDSYSPNARFLRYAKGRVRHFWMRQNMTVFGALGIAMAISNEMGLLLFFTALVGELVDCGTLRFALLASKGGTSIDNWKRRAACTAMVQSATISACILIPVVYDPRPETVFFSCAFLTAATINAGLALPYFLVGGWLRLGVYTFALLAILAVTALSGTLTVIEMLALAALAYSVAVFIQFVSRAFNTRQTTEVALVRQRAELANKIASLEATRKELDTLALVARHANDSVILSDADGHIKWVNEAFSQITGYTKEEVIGRTPSDFLNSPRATQDASDEIEQAKKEGRVARIEVLNMRKDGSDIWIETSIVPIPDANGDIHTILSVERDVTSAKKHEEELRAAQIKADEGARAKSRFFATISHEIRTPMNAVLGMSELLMDSELGEQERGYSETIHDSASALLDIVNDILDLSKLESGKFEICRAPVDLKKTVLSATGLFRAAFEQKALSCNVSFSDNIPEFVDADAGRLRQILVNVIGNALKFTTRGGITVDVRPDGAGNLVVFTVADTGIGIEPKNLAHIFDAFSQADGTTAQNFGGTGLGLSISRQLAHLMGGDISAQSEVGVGSTFTVTLDLPAVTSAKNQVQSTPVDLPPDLSILVADDNATNRLLVRKYLDGFDVQLDEVSDGAKAVQTARTKQPDIILMDMQMPVMDGLSASVSIRAIPPPGRQPVIIALTANVDAEDRARCLAAGMDLFLSKPIRKTALLEMIAKACIELDARPPQERTIAAHSA